ncbi:TMEM131 [Symbiodinium pilosum]|uniref:TMEM131 protein n=1 Tax=Symbiodinium pilosum TaxID=2952 RepID=A0A812IV16_SYMPI|nr:TMEM131 [Symbiodinium pilosum]
MRFDPPELEFNDELTCVPHHSQVRIYCDGCHAIISVDSVSSDMEAVYPALVPKSGKQPKKKGKSPTIGIMYVMFLAHQPGEVRGRISVKTTAGLVHYQVKGFAAANPYKAEAIHNLKVGAGEVVHHPLSIFNPWKDPLQISQVSSNESFIQLLAPEELRQVGHKNSPAGSSFILADRAAGDWTIPPEQHGIVGYTKFTLQQGQYQGFVEVKMEAEVPRIVVPVVLGVVRSSGIKISPDIVDFQTLVSSIQASCWAARGCCLFLRGVLQFCARARQGQARCSVHVHLRIYLALCHEPESAANSAAVFVRPDTEACHCRWHLTDLPVARSLCYEGQSNATEESESADIWV